MIPSTVSQLAELAAELATELAAELTAELAAELATELAAIGEHRYAPRGSRGTQRYWRGSQ